jgi:hypothetical protein
MQRWISLPYFVGPRRRAELEASRVRWTLRRPAIEIVGLRRKAEPEARREMGRNIYAEYDWEWWKKEDGQARNSGRGEKVGLRNQSIRQTHGHNLHNFAMR